MLDGPGTTSDEPHERRALARLGERWSLDVLTALEQGSRRYHELEASVDGISRRMLSRTLRGLEGDALVLRSVDASPIRVHYALTDAGRALLEAVEPLLRWARAYGRTPVERPGSEPPLSPGRGAR